MALNFIIVAQTAHLHDKYSICQVSRVKWKRNPHRVITDCYLKLRGLCAELPVGRRIAVSQLSSGGIL